MKENSIERDMHLLESYAGMTHKMNDNQGRPKLDQAIEHILSDYKRVLKENEELKQDRNNNYQMIALAQNEALGYMQGYEDGKKLKRSAVANIVENQQYYIFNKQIEHYKEYIVKLQKENKELKEYISIAPNLDEMTAVKYRNIQQDAYIKGRAEEQQRAEQIIYENYIPNQKVKDVIKKLKEEGESDFRSYGFAVETHLALQALQELLEGGKKYDNRKQER